MLDLVLVEDPFFCASQQTLGGSFLIKNGKAFTKRLKCISSLKVRLNSSADSSARIATRSP